MYMNLLTDPVSGIGDGVFVWGILYFSYFGLRIKRRPEALIFGFGQLLKGWTVMERLSEIRIPTLVLAGRHDFQFPPEHQAILVNRITDAQLAIVECAGHNAPMERTAEVIKIIKRFMGVN
jgi:proline iminopeptidase